MTMVKHVQVSCLNERCGGAPVKRLIYRLLEVAVTEVNLTGQVIASECSHPRGEFSHSLSGIVNDCFPDSRRSESTNWGRAECPLMAESRHSEPLATPNLGRFHLISGHLRA